MPLAQRSVDALAGRVSVHLSTCWDWNLAEAIVAFESLGLNRVGVWRRRLEEFGEERGVELLRDHRVVPSSLSWAGGFTGQGGVTLREAHWDAAVALDHARAIGAPALLVTTGGRSGHSRGHLGRLLREELPIVGDNAAERGVRALVHVAGGTATSRWSCLNSVGHALDVVQQCRHSALGLAVDLRGLARDKGAIDRLPELIPHLGLVLLREFPGPEIDAPERKPEQDLRWVVARLESAGYRGHYELHLPPRRVAPEQYAVVLRHYRARLANCLAVAHSLIATPAATPAVLPAAEVVRIARA
ncbi:MAG: sugar phosphate isomerase/epimerase family protein [Planctomycetaceae bacterium]